MEGAFKGDLNRMEGAFKRDLNKMEGSFKKDLKKMEVSFQRSLKKGFKEKLKPIYKKLDDHDKQFEVVHLKLEYHDEQFVRIFRTLDEMMVILKRLDGNTAHLNYKVERHEEMLLSLNAKVGLPHLA